MLILDGPRTVSRANCLNESVKKERKVASKIGCGLASILHWSVLRLPTWSLHSRFFFKTHFGGMLRGYLVI